jgi:uncharacterized RDD family membrane protein YckC
MQSDRTRRAEPPLDTSIDVVTPENIAFKYEAAGPFRRLPAYLIDLCIMAVVIMLAGMILGFAGLLIGGFAEAAMYLFLFVFFWFYGALFEIFWNGQTPGKRLLSIRVLTNDGRPINGPQGIMRNLLRIVDLFPPVVLPGVGMTPIPTAIVGITAMTLSPRFQRLGDLVCGTMVVLEEKSWLTGVSKLEDPRAAQLADYIPADFVVSRELSKTLSTYVERRRFFSPARRREIARRLAEPLLVHFRLPADTSWDLLLCALYYRSFVADRGAQTGGGESALLGAAGPNPAAAAQLYAQQARENSRTPTTAPAIVGLPQPPPVHEFTGINT